MSLPVPISAIQALENEGLKQPQIDIETKHYTARGVYAREVTIPAKSVVTGRVHLRPQINILSKGRMRVTTEEGVIEVEAPFTIVSPPGTKRAVYTLTECVWTTILATTITDPQEAYNLLTVGTEQEYLELTEDPRWLS